METKQRNRHRAGVGLFLLGSLIVAVGAWLPWMVYSQAINPGAPETIQYYYDPGIPPPGSGQYTPLLGALHGPLAVLAAWSLVTTLGLALGPLLTASTSRWLPRVGHALAGLWLLVMSALVVAITVAIAQGVYKLPLCPLCKAGTPMSFKPVSLQVGPFIAVAGLVLGWLGWALALGGLWSASSGADSAPAATGPVPARRFEFGLLGTGIVVWALGFYFMPWVTQNCGTVWFFGTCSGFPANAVAQSALSSEQVLDPFIMRYTVPLILGIGALYLLVALARRAFVTRAARAWLGAWLVLALTVGGVAIAGAQTIIHTSDNATPPLTGPNTTQLVVGLGMAVAAFGLLLLLVGWIVAVVMSLLERPALPPASS